MSLPKSKSMIIARYLVFDGVVYFVCRYNYKTKFFEEYRKISANGRGTWWEWTQVSYVGKWIRLDNNKSINWNKINT
jgi:hypothetical protein